MFYILTEWIRYMSEFVDWSIKQHLMKDKPGFFLVGDGPPLEWALWDAHMHLEGGGQRGGRGAREWERGWSAFLGVWSHTLYLYVSQLYQMSIPKGIKNGLCMYYIAWFYSLINGTYSLLIRNSQQPYLADQCLSN